MNIASKIAARLNTGTDELFFDECSYFTFSRSCTVKFDGVWFDVWFDEAYNIANIAKAN